jgi:hypothetical protein
MNLADLRRVSIKTNVRIRFTLSNGMECVLNEHGIAQVPALHAIPGFNLEAELAQAAQFTLEPAATLVKGKPKPRILTREQMSSLAGGRPSDAGHADHDDE